MFRDIIDQVRLENYSLSEDSLTYSRDEDVFTVTDSTVTYSTGMPVRARATFNRLSQGYENNFFIQSFRVALRETPLPELAEIERSESAKTVLLRTYTAGNVPDLVELLQAYFA